MPSSSPFEIVTELEAALSSSPPAPVLLPTGVGELDAVTGGYPAGVVEVSGPPSVGKTALSLIAAGAALRLGFRAGVVDCDKQHDHAVAEHFGAGGVVVALPSCGEDALEAATAMLGSGTRLVVIDSASTMAPLGSVESSLVDSDGSVQGRLLSHGFRKLAWLAFGLGATVIVTNQVRHGRGVPGSGGKRHMDSLWEDVALTRLALSRDGTARHGGYRTGFFVKVGVTKSTSSIPFAEARFELKYMDPHNGHPFGVQF